MRLTGPVTHRHDEKRKSIVERGKRQEWGIENEHGQNVLLMLSRNFKKWKENVGIHTM